MKKFIYSLAMLALGLSSCNSWDDPVTENYGDGPSIEIAIAATTDSAVTFTLTPAQGTQFYNFITDASNEAEELDATALLKGSYGNAANVKNAADKPTFTYTIKAEPNTTYQIYAVAASDKGIVGKVAVASATTTDGNAPALTKGAFKADPETKSVAVTFDQALKRGTGAVSAIYYKEWDWENPVTVDPADITVTIKDNVATFAAPKTPAGAIVAFSWAAGAFVDAKGNACGAYTTLYDEEEDDFIGAAVQNAKVDFEIADSLFADIQTSFKDAAQFKGVATFDFDLYRIDEGKTAVKDGDVCVTYTNDKKTTTIKLTPEQWNVSGKQLYFTLPEGVEGGDKVTLSVKKGVIYDVYGNPNAAFTSEKAWWKYVTFAPTVEDVTGTFTYYVTLNADGKTHKLGNFTIAEYTGEDAEPGDVVISGLYLDDSEIYGYYDLTESKLYIQRYQLLGTYEYKGATYGVLTSSSSGQKWVEFDITEDGIISKDFALVYTDVAVTEILGDEVPAGTTYFVKVEAPAAARSAANFAKKNGFKKYANVVKNVKTTSKKSSNVIRSRK